MSPASPENAWKNWQRISFRFFFLLLGSSTLICWEAIIGIAFFDFNKKYQQFFESVNGPFLKPLHWLDKMIFHTGYVPDAHEIFPGDNHFGIVVYLTFMLCALLGTVIWSILDKKRRSYEKLFFWFNLYLRYILAMVFFIYGIDKLIPVQMTYPGPYELLTPLGHQNRFYVLWNFIGVSPGFSMFAGASEIVGSLMLLGRRTMVFGAMLTCAVLSNVVAFNWFYNVPVKLFSAQLLIYGMYLLVPYAPALWSFFFRAQPAVLETRKFALQTPWKKTALAVKLVLVPLVILLLTTISVNKRYRQWREDRLTDRIYEVTSFVAKDTLPPLLTDTLRWKKFAFDCSIGYKPGAIIYSMRDEPDAYQCDVDSIRKTFTLHDNPDKSTWHEFRYEYPSRDQLVLKGKWKGRDVIIRMKETFLDSLPLNKEKISLLND